MFRNYLVTALRNIAKHKLYGFINIAGLAVGLACVIFILLYIQDETSYDRWVPDSLVEQRPDTRSRTLAPSTNASPGQPYGGCPGLASIPRPDAGGASVPPLPAASPRPRGRGRG